MPEEFVHCLSLEQEHSVCLLSAALGHTTHLHRGSALLTLSQCGSEFQGVAGYAHLGRAQDGGRRCGLKTDPILSILMYFLTEMVPEANSLPFYLNPIVRISSNHPQKGPRELICATLRELLNIENNFFLR